LWKRALIERAYNSGPEPVGAVYDRAYGVSLCKPPSIKVPWMNPENARRTKNFNVLPFGFLLARKVPNRTECGIARGSGASRREKPLICGMFFATAIEGGHP